jgi:hypothetical protein
VSKLPGIGEERASDVLAYEFMADFRVHARLRERAPPTAPAEDWSMEAEAADDESVVKQAYMTLPPSIGIPSIAPSCFSCFDYTNGLADLVVGYMGAPFDGGADEMVTAPLMVTIRNPRGRELLERAVASGRVEVLQDGGHGGRGLPSEGDRRPITMKTVAADSMVRSLTEPGFVAGDAGAPPFVANLLASIIAKTLPKGMEFARYSIDYHFLRNQLFVEDYMGAKRAGRHVPTYATALMRRYDAQMAALREGGGGSSGDGSGTTRIASGGATGILPAAVAQHARAWGDTLCELFLLI